MKVAGVVVCMGIVGCSSQEQQAPDDLVPDDGLQEEAPPEEVPEAPEVPEEPEVPPDVPEEPEVPETPEVPEEPEIPEIPETPEVPDPGGEGNADCSVASPCAAGQGDCNGDAECQPGTFCMRDVGAAYGFAASVDMCETACVAAEPGYLGTIDFCSESCPCEEGQGDCDSHSECAAGLRCGSDLGAEFGFDGEVDVCMSPQDDLMNGSRDHCSMEFPCATGHGDCDSHDQCQAGLRCGFGIGAHFGFDADADVCVPPHDDLVNGNYDHCSLEFPCATGHGDCDSHSECMPGNRCVSNVGANYGFSEGIDVCEEGAVEVTFSGRVAGSLGEPVAGVRVSVNGESRVTSSSGSFTIRVLQAERYVINTEALGYVPNSRIHAGGAMQDLVIDLQEAETFTIDPTRPVAVVDEAGTQISLPAGALVDAQGNPPAGPVTMQVHTFNPVTEGMVGDMAASNDGGEPVILDSVGAVSVDFVDEAGTEYGLASGNTAQISLQVAPEIDYSGAIPMWHYDMDTGLWIEEGVGMVQNGVATATVSHFSVWNFDLEKRNPACVRVFVAGGLIDDGESLNARVKVTGNFPRTRDVSFTGGHNALFNLPFDTDIEVYIPPQATAPIYVIDSGAPWGGRGAPPFPYQDCNAELHIDAAFSGVVVGFVKLDQQDSSEGITVTASLDGETVGSVAVNPAGRFHMPLDPDVAHTLTLDRPGHLSVEIPNVTVESGKLRYLTCFQLRAGDVNGDNVIDQVDEALVSNELNTGVAAGHPADFNGDQRIDSDDLQVVQANLGMAGPLSPGDGFSGCFDNSVYEREPNDDGTPEVGGGSTTGNDFSIANVGAAHTSSVVISAQFSPLGDEDVFAVSNDRTYPRVVRLETYNKNQDPGEPCNKDVDTVIQVRDASGASLASNDDGTGSCSRLNYTMAAGQTIYVHVLEHGDNNNGGYYLEVDFID